MPRSERLRQAIRKSWTDDTAYKGEWDKETGNGQCAVTALVVQDVLGGEIVDNNSKRERHFWNRIDGEDVDFIDVPEQEKSRKRRREDLLRIKNVRERYEILKKRVMKEMEGVEEDGKRTKNKT